MPDLNTDCDILVIGAGAAGIAAARAVRAAGHRVLLLEARPRLGGRAWTDTAALGAPFDLGASWLHAAGTNPLVPLARDLGLPLHDGDALRHDLTFIGDRLATREELAAYDAAWQAFDAAIADGVARLEREGGPDLPVSAAAPRGGPWDATVAHWQGQTIAAAELDRMSLLDFSANLLNGGNLLPEGGLGALVARLAEGLPVRLSAPVTHLRWGGPVAVAEGPFGAVTARAVIATLPTPLLAGGAIRFDPPLPADRLEAAANLPLGLLAKIGLRATGTDRLDLPPHAALDRQVAEGETMLTAIAWPFGQDHVIGFVGGQRAWELEAAGPAALIEFAMEELAARLGNRVRRALRPALTTGWGTDPFSRGAYSHARVGGAGARRALAAPLAGGRLMLAGEACHPTLSGTVGGAWLSGEAAARAALASLVQPRLHPVR